MYLQIFVVVCKISIPYGAIKSENNIILIFEIIEFQFLMVRLKVAMQYLQEIVPKRFQFLMVRLKVFNFFVFIILFFYFNSLWCD